jgi:hypothetical protein
MVAVLTQIKATAGRTALDRRLARAQLEAV